MRLCFNQLFSNFCSLKMSEQLWWEKKKSFYQPTIMSMSCQGYVFKSNTAIFSNIWIEWNFEKSLCLCFSDAPPVCKTLSTGRWGAGSRMGECRYLSRMVGEGRIWGTCSRCGLSAPTPKLLTKVATHPAWKQQCKLMGLESCSPNGGHFLWPSPFSNTPAYTPIFS